MPSAGETLRALAETVVPGPPDDPTPGAATIEAERFIAHYLDLVAPGLSASAASLLDHAAGEHRDGASFAALPRRDRESILAGLCAHEVDEIRQLGNLLSALSIAAVYGEWSGQDSEGTLTRRPLGWELTGWAGPRSAVRSLLRD